MNFEIIEFEKKHFSLQKLSEIYKLNNIKEFKQFLLLLVEKNILDKECKNILENGSSKLTLDEEGYYEFSCSYYDRIYWTDYGIQFQHEHGSSKKFKSNMELSCFKEILSK